jgi:bile acid:Na+ symporter, BASS family
MGLTQYLVLALQVSVALTVLGLGLTASWQDATYLLRHPGLLFRSVLSMGIVMPLVAVAIAMLFSFPVTVEIVLVALMLSPVPPLLYKKQIGAGGDREYVVALLATMGTLSIVLIPLSIAILNAYFATSVQVAPLGVAKVVLTSVLVPLFLGLAIHRWFPAAEKAAGHLITLAGLLLVVGAVLLLYAVWPVTRTFLGNGVALMLAGVVVIGLCVGHLLGGPVPGERTTLAIATAQRHPAVALTIASAISSSKKPELALILLYVVIATIVIIPYQKWRARAARAP